MQTIVFGWTTPAMLAGAKSVIRCPWAAKTAARFHAGDLVAGCERSPRAGGRPLALLRLLADPIREPLADMPDTDYVAEGWQWLFEHPDVLAASRYARSLRQDDFSWQAFERWRARPLSTWVVRFELLAVLELTHDRPADRVAARASCSLIA
jgi:hypothetical protein